MFNIRTKEWTRGPSTPYAQGAGDALTWSYYDNRLYAIVGSREHNGGRSFFIRYDPQTSTWERLPFIWRYTEDGAALAAAGEYIYALQGEAEERRGTENCKFARYHIPTSEWEELTPIPDPGGVGDGGSLVWAGLADPKLEDLLIALGGGAADESPGHGVFAFSISQNTWTKLPDLPCPVGYYVGNRLAIAAGRIFYWQGATKKYPCEGAAFGELAFSPLCVDLSVSLLEGWKKSPEGEVYANILVENLGGIVAPDVLVFIDLPGCYEKATVKLPDATEVQAMNYVVLSLGTVPAGGRLQLRIMGSVDPRYGETPILVTVSANVSECDLANNFLFLDVKF